MDWSTIAASSITTVGVIVAAWLSFRGVRHTQAAARKANAEEGAAEKKSKADEAEQARFREAWPELLDNIRTEFVEPLREEVAREREARQELASEVDELRRTVRSLSSEVDRWRRAARALARWGVALRERLRELGGPLPADPEELELLHAIEDQR